MCNPSDVFVVNSGRNQQRKPIKNSEAELTSKLNLKQKPVKQKVFLAAAAAAAAAASCSWDETDINWTN